MNWAEYADTARRLADVRDREAERQAHAAERTQGGHASIGGLRKRLEAQRTYLAELAVALREPRPSFDGVARNGITDVDEALRLAQDAIEQADAEAGHAQKRGERPALLPGMSTTGRNLLVYLAATVVAWLASCGLYAINPQRGSTSVGLLAWSLCGLPALAFFAGYFTIAVFGRPRIQTSEKASHSVRLGGVICFVGMWLGWVLFIAVTTVG